MHDIGEVFAGFTIERMLGQGGMGTVYLARHPRLDRLTALKLLNRDLFADERIRARFEREADLAAGLDHPGIVTVFDRGTEGEQLWISMQYVDGVDAATVDPMTLPPERAVQIVEGVADALDYAHGRGVLHRDVKPANVLLARSSGGQGERVFLTDFGIARLRADSTHLTQQGMFTATLAYASPEQMTGTELDHRSDQYSLACTLYWLLTGIAPFDSPDPNEIIRGTLYLGPPPLALRRPGLPPALDAVLAAAMAKHPAARFDSCTAFTTAARQALTSTTPPVLPRPTTPPPTYYPPAPQPGAAPFARQGYPPAPQPNWPQQPPARPAATPQPPAVPYGAPPPAGAPPFAAPRLVPAQQPPAPPSAQPGVPPPVAGQPPTAQPGPQPPAVRPGGQSPSAGVQPSGAQPAGQPPLAPPGVQSSGAQPPSSSPAGQPSAGLGSQSPPGTQNAGSVSGQEDSAASDAAVVSGRSRGSASREEGPRASGAGGDSSGGPRADAPGDVSATAATDVVARPKLDAREVANANARTDVAAVASHDRSGRFTNSESSGDAVDSVEMPRLDVDAADSTSSSGTRGPAGSPGDSAARASDGARVGDTEHGLGDGQQDVVQAAPDGNPQRSGDSQANGPDARSAGVPQSPDALPSGSGVAPGGLSQGEAVPMSAGADGPATGGLPMLPPGPDGPATGGLPMLRGQAPWTGQPPGRPVGRSGKRGRVSGLHRFGWLMLGFLVLALVALLLALVVVVLPGDDDEAAPSAAGGSAPTSATASISELDEDSLIASRQIFPTLVPQGAATVGPGYRGARCAAVRDVSELEWKEPALQWNPITIGWQCERVGNGAAAVSYLVLEYADPAHARSVVGAMPGAVRYEGDKDGVPFVLRRWAVADPASARIQTAHQVVSFPDDEERANYLIVVSRRGSSGANGAPRPSAQDEVIAWWDEVPL
ncbi:protein kinase [Nocardia sp. NPDC059177]|uniref:serine/threonine-protein kinase n=1 Tax=Nocardia sp. NPDC059177 TaxID=3346759 RepID=UPI0036821D97